MSRSVVPVAWIVGLIAVVVAVDVLFFRGHGWARLAANVGIVLLFGAFYLRFHPSGRSF